MSRASFTENTAFKDNGLSVTRSLKPISGIVSVLCELPLHAWHTACASFSHQHIAWPWFMFPLFPHNDSLRAEFSLCPKAQLFLSAAINLKPTKWNFCAYKLGNPLQTEVCPGTDKRHIYRGKLTGTAASPMLTVPMHWNKFLLMKQNLIRWSKQLLQFQAYRQWLFNDII